MTKKLYLNAVNNFFIDYKNKKYSPSEMKRFGLPVSNWQTKITDVEAMQLRVLFEIQDFYFLKNDINPESIKSNEDVDINLNNIEQFFLNLKNKEYRQKDLILSGINPNNWYLKTPEPRNLNLEKAVLVLNFYNKKTNTN